MKEYTKRLVQFQAYDYDGIREYLEKQAAEGWQLDRIGAFLWGFRKTVPAHTHYSVVYRPEISQYDPANAGAQKEFEEKCRALGWSMVAHSSKMQIYRSYEKDPRPIEADGEETYRNIRSSMLKSYVIPLLILIVILNLNANGLAGIIRGPIYILSSWTGLLGALLTMAVTLTFALSIAGFLLWCHSTRKSLISSGGCAPSSRFRGIYKVTNILIAAVILLYFAALILESRSMFAALAIAFVIAILLVVILVRTLTSKMREAGVSRSRNRFISLGSAIVLAIVLTIAFFVVTGMVMDRTDSRDAAALDGMPLLAKDLFATPEEKSVYEWKQSGTPFLQRDVGAEYAADEDASEYYDLSYEILHVDKDSILYDLSLKQWIHEGNGALEPIFPANTTYEKIDSSAFMADAVYRQYWADSDPEDQWIFCYPDRLVKISAFSENDDVTTNDLKTIDRKLGK